MRFVETLCCVGLIGEAATFLAGVAGMATSQVLSNKFKDGAIGMVKSSEFSHLFAKETRKACEKNLTTQA